MKSFRFPARAIGLLILTAAMALNAAEIHVSAAASLLESLKEIAVSYEKGSGDKIVFNFGASSTIARQIEEGAPADLFFSADEAQMNNLEKKGRIVPETRTNLLSNTLVIVTIADSRLTISSARDLTIPSIKRLALAEPKAVPAGVYAREYLTRLDLWAAVETKVIPTENVRAALAAVESGDVEAGIVYKTDAAISKKVKIAFEVPVEEGPKIRYPAALVKEAREPEAARRFLKHLTSREAAGVFAKSGFIVLP